MDRFWSLYYLFSLLQTLAILFHSPKDSDVLILTDAKVSISSSRASFNMFKRCHVGR